MIKNYIKIALRTLWRDRAFSFINLVGLAIGLASVLMIMAYVRYELSYDESYSNAPNVYRVHMVIPLNGVPQQQLRTPAGLGAALQKEFPSVSGYSIVNQTSLQFNYKSNLIKMEALQASPDFFKLFNFKFISGNALNALKEPDCVVITESAAKKYFPGVNAIGRTIDIKHARTPLKVTGIIKDIPDNTHFNAEAIVSLEGSGLNKAVLNMRGYTGVPQYILLNSHHSAAQLEEQFKSIYKKYDFKTVTLKLVPVRNIHLYSHTDEEFMPNGDIKYIYIFSSIAFLILLVACINYINLTTARSIQRAREIGVRKVLGAIKKQLIIQFVSESFLFFTACLIVGLLIAIVCWPAFSIIIDRNGHHIPLFDAWSVILIPVIVLIFGLMSGVYPAFILSKVKTAQVLKGIAAFGENVSLRKVLVGVQFVISGVLIVSTIVIYRQLNFINNARLGFNKEHLITIPFFMFDSHVKAFKNELTTNNNVKSISVASWAVGKYFGESASAKDENDTSRMVKMEFINADPDFIETMGIDVIHGRNFSRNNTGDMLNIDSATSKLADKDPNRHRIELSQSYIVNEEALKTLHIKYKDGLVLNKGIVQGTIIGVVRNFNGLTLHEKIPAIAIRCRPGVDFGLMYVRISPANMQQTIAFIQKKWSKFYPDQTFEFSFVDEKLQQLYSADKRVGELFGTFAVLGIIISCLGLFALISLTVQQRVKEIGIRKVLGASVINITTLLSVGFLRLVVLSMLIASPIAWYIMNKWLQDFAYRVQITWWMFALAGIVAVIVAFVTVSFQSAKAAMANPVKSLRSE